MSKTAEPADINVDELRRRARRRLVGAVVLALGVAVVVPMLLETEQKPLGEDVSVKIPPVDDGKFVNRLNDPKAASGKPQDAVPSTSEPASAPAPSDAPVSSDAPARASKYDTRIPDATSAATQAAASADSAAPAKPSSPAAPAPPTADAHPSNATPDKAASGSEKPVIITDKGASANERPATRASERPSASERASSSASERASSTSERPPAASGHRDGFAVQLAAFADDKGANSLAGRLKRAGYAAYTEPLKTSKGTLWRVRVGPYPSREAALAARDKLKTEGQNGIVAAIR